MSEGRQVTIAHAKSFVDQVLIDDEGWNNTKGECATGVQYVFFKAGNPLGKTKTWRKGIKVKGNNILPGTAIASFREDNDQFQNDHAAILIKETPSGLEVFDQYNHPPKSWGIRTLRFSNNKDYSNNGELFYVIELKPQVRSKSSRRLPRASKRSSSSIRSSGRPNRTP